MTGGNSKGSECPPVAGTTEGARIAVGANAPLSYMAARAAGKGPAAQQDNNKIPADHPAPIIRGEYGGAAFPFPKGTRIAFRATTGQIWAYKGKRGRVLYMLVKMGGGVTQWDCLPWHTRLGASVHVLRCDGLVIDTEREGDCRHARYTLRTAGSLIIQAKNSHAATTRAGNAQ